MNEVGVTAPNGSGMNAFRHRSYFVKEAIEADETRG